MRELVDELSGYDLSNGWDIRKHLMSGGAEKSELSKSLNIGLPVPPPSPPSSSQDTSHVLRSSRSAITPRKPRSTPITPHLSPSQEMDEDEEYQPRISKKRPSLSPSGASKQEATRYRRDAILKELGELADSVQHDILTSCLDSIDKSTAPMSVKRFSLADVISAMNECSLEAPIASRLAHRLATSSLVSIHAADVAEALGVALRTYHLHHRPISAATMELEEQHGARGRPTLPEIDKIRPEGESQVQLLGWLKDNTNVKSGTRNYRKLRQTSFLGAHQQYSTDLPNALSYSRFVKLLHQWGIHTEH